MKKSLGGIFLWLSVGLTGIGQQKLGVQFFRDDINRKVDISLNGIYFTSLIYPDSLEKPVLYPLLAASGVWITRGFPIAPRPGERVDHPHHIGWWFNYGDVNGIDFWNNSYAIPEKEKDHYGQIVLDSILECTDGKEKGILTYKSGWFNHRRELMLSEKTTFVFSGEGPNRKVVRITALTANQDLTFGDNKEGMCALRVDRAFEQPSDKPEVFTDAGGRPTRVPVLNNQGVNGHYKSSDGKEGDAVWGTRARWVSLSARKDGDSIAIVLFDHQGNYGYPAHWHARGYGLFSLNNLGSRVYNPADPEVKLILHKGETLIFRHQLFIKSGGFPSDEEINHEWDKFNQEY